MTREQQLEEALRSLRNEAKALLSVGYLEIIAASSVTNVRCLENRIAEADALLASRPSDCAVCSVPRRADEAD